MFATTVSKDSFNCSHGLLKSKRKNVPKNVFSIICILHLSLHRKIIKLDFLKRWIVKFA